jgi:hypothetical protein
LRPDGPIANSAAAAPVEGSTARRRHARLSRATARPRDA